MLTAKGEPDLVTSDLMLRIFRFFYVDIEDSSADEVSVLHLIVDATNENARALVVKAQTRKGYAMAGPDAPRGHEHDTAAGPHARFRWPDIVRDPLTENELLVFLGIRLLMGANWR